MKILKVKLTSIEGGLLVQDRDEYSLDACDDFDIQQTVSLQMKNGKH